MDSKDSGFVLFLLLCFCFFRLIFAVHFLYLRLNSRPDCINKGSVSSEPSARTNALGSYIPINFFFSSAIATQPPQFDLSSSSVHNSFRLHYELFVRHDCRICLCLLLSLPSYSIPLVNEMNFISTSSGPLFFRLLLLSP